MTACVSFKGKNLLSGLAVVKYLEGLESTVTANGAFKIPLMGQFY